MFENRMEAGRVLAAMLKHYAGRDDTLVLALPRGGVPVGAEVARALGAPLDVFMVRIPQRAISEAIDREQKELARRERLYRDDWPLSQPCDKTVILVDDGLATGATMRAAAGALRGLGARRIVVAVPVAAPRTCQEFREDVDEVICAQTPERFRAVGEWYVDFSQTTDDEVRDLLRAAKAHAH